MSDVDHRREATNVLAARLFDAFEQSDVEVFRELVHPEATFWNPFREIDATRLAAVLATGEPMVPGLRYDAPERQVFADGSGFVQRHTVRGVGPDGPLNLPACVVGLVREGKLTRLEMFYDTYPVTTVGLGGDREH
jgi:ketosteroid isomerase-like protein